MLNPDFRPKIVPAVPAGQSEWGCADRTDYDNGYRAYYMGVPRRYYDYSGAALAGWDTAKHQHECDMDEAERAGFPQDGSVIDFVAAP